MSKALNVRIPEDLDDAVEDCARARDESKAAFVKRALRDAIARDRAIAAPGGGDIVEVAETLERAGRSFETAIGAIGRVASILKKKS